MKGSHIHIFFTEHDSVAYLFEQKKKKKFQQIKKQKYIVSIRTKHPDVQK